MPVRLARRTSAGDPSFATASRGEHPHQRPSQGAAGEEISRVGERPRYTCEIVFRSPSLSVIIRNYLCLLFVDLTDVCTCTCSAATNIFIHGNEEHAQLANEVRFLWGQNQALNEQLNMGSRGEITHFYNQEDKPLLSQ